MYREYTKFSAEFFIDELNSNLYDFNDNKLSSANFLNLNELLDEFVSIMKQTIDSHASMKLASRKEQKLLKRPWQSNGILTSKKNKRCIKHIFCLTMKL